MEEPKYLGAISESTYEMKGQLNLMRAENKKMAQQIYNCLIGIGFLLAYIALK